MYANYNKWNSRINSPCRTKQYNQNMNYSQPNFQRIWDYNNNWNTNSNFHKRNVVCRNFNHGWNNQRNQSRNYSVDAKRNNHLNNFSNVKSSGRLSANAVIMKIMTLLCEKRKNDPNRAKTKFIKREPLPPFTGTTCIGEEGITEGFFCEFCKVYLMDKEQSDKHLLTKSHFRKYVEYLNVNNTDKWETSKPIQDDFCQKVGNHFLYRS